MCFVSVHKVKLEHEHKTESRIIQIIYNLLNHLQARPLTKLKPLAHRERDAAGGLHFHQPNRNAVLIPSRPGRKLVACCEK